MTRRKAIVTTVAAVVGTTLPAIATPPDPTVGRVSFSVEIVMKKLMTFNDDEGEQVGQLYSKDGILDFEGDPKASAAILMRSAIGGPGLVNMTFETENRIHTFDIAPDGSVKFKGKLQPDALKFFQGISDRWSILRGLAEKNII